MRFKSKKNRATLEGGIVVKRHGDRDSLLHEARTLEHLRQAGLAVPALLGVETNTLKLEYMEGPTYVDLVETMTPEQAEALGAWLADYHRITGFLRGDCNLRNFLWANGRCVGVDFEYPPTCGEREMDMGKILAFAVTYDPPFTPAKAACGRLIIQAFRQTGGMLEIARIREAYLHEIALMNDRRRNFFAYSHSAASFFDGLC